MDTKQVIVIRKDLNMRKGKMIAQGSHASMAFLTKTLKIRPCSKFIVGDEEWSSAKINVSEETISWLDNSFRKIVCYVDSEEELLEIHNKALNAGLISHLIEDNGTTEFGGIKTKTCIAIGPHFCSKFEGLTDHLPLL